MYMRGGMGKYQGLKRYRPMRGVPGLGQTPDVQSSIQYLGVVNGGADQTGVNQMIATPLSPAQISAMSIGNAAMFGSQAGLGPYGSSTPDLPPIPGTRGSLSPTQWLNQNAVTVVIGTAVFLVAWKALSK